MLGREPEKLSDHEEVQLIVNTFVDLLESNEKSEKSLLLNPFLESVGVITARYLREHYPDVKNVIHHLGIHGFITVDITEETQITTHHHLGAEIEDVDKYTNFSTFEVLLSNF